MKTNFEQDARAVQDFSELKELIIKMSTRLDEEYLKGNDYENKDIERIEERISNIETCIEDNKLNTDSLRL